MNTFAITVTNGDVEQVSATAFSDARRAVTSKLQAEWRTNNGKAKNGRGTNQNQR